MDFRSYLPFRFLLTFYELLVADWLGVCQYFYHFSTISMYFWWCRVLFLL